MLFFQFDPTKMDRVELAFRKFDLNQDGYLSREEFDQVSFHVIFFSYLNSLEIWGATRIEIFTVELHWIELW